MQAMRFVLTRPMWRGENKSRLSYSDEIVEDAAFVKSVIIIS